jgi:hypothetical protein
MDINIKLVDEISMIFFWVGTSGLLERIINTPILIHSKMYIYAILLLFAIYLKVS